MQEQTPVTFLDSDYTEATAAVVLDRAKSSYFALEDQRVQGRLIALYPEAEYALSSVNPAFFADYDGDLADQAKIVRGLSGVPADMRTIIDAAYVKRHGQDASDQLSRVVFEYRDLQPDREFERMLELAVKLTRLEVPDLLPPPDRG